MDCAQGGASRYPLLQLRLIYIHIYIYISTRPLPAPLPPLPQQQQQLHVSRYCSTQLAPIPEIATHLQQRPLTQLLPFALTQPLPS